MSLRHGHSHNNAHENPDYTESADNPKNRGSYSRNGHLIVAWAVLGISVFSSYASGEALSVVAAENFYGDVAQQLGGQDVHVVSILSNPSQDPHLFEASASTARALADAKLVIYNGADYDPWMTKLLSVSTIPGRKIIVVADLAHKKAGDNPHLWYDPAVVTLLAKAIAADLIAGNPASRDTYEKRLESFADSLKPLNAKIETMRQKYMGTTVTATEPVFNYMADALGLKMRNLSFQLAVMNNSEPSVKDVASFQNDLKGHKVKVLFYNSQVSENLTDRMRRIAIEAKVPVVGVTETEPAGARYQDWMTGQLDALDRALSGADR